jgi:hypothetical protein
MWFWNGLPNDARAITGYLIGRGSDKLMIGGQGPSAGRLLFGGIAGRTEIVPKRWHHITFVRDGRTARIYLNGILEISGEAPPTSSGDLFVGGHEQASDTLEGKIDEVALYRRALAAGEIAQRHKLTGL